MNEAKARVSGVRGAIHQGYRTVPQAEAAYAYALARSWTRVCRASRLSPPSQDALPMLPSPSQPMDGANPLHPGQRLTGTWYIVYRGILPGVYHSTLVLLFNDVPSS